MTNDVLLKLLQAGLLTDLGDDDQRRERAETAAEGVLEWLVGEGRSEFASAVLGSVDESGTGAAAALERADQCLVAAWPAVRNVFADPPVDLLRAIVFHAALAAADSDEELEAVIWYALRFSKALEVSAGRWAPIVDAEASRIDAAVSARLDRAWLPAADVIGMRMPPTHSSEPIEELAGKSAALTQALEPHAADYAQSAAPVVQILAEHLPAALAELEGVVGALVEGSASGGDLKAFSEKLGVALRAQLEAQWSVVEASQLRERLLWWRLAGYSAVLDQRYADIEDPAICALVAAVDIGRLVPSVAPVAVEHLLAETVTNYQGTKGSIGFADLEAAWKRIDRDVMPRVEGSGLVVAALAAGQASAAVLAVPAAMTPAAAATLVFQELQAIRLLTPSASEPEPEP